ncbi:MAG: magnesium chelatase, partial [Actinomycetota bacterium]|nr:magnesium chelatase [Actinomycetota bacterium]
EQLLAQVGRVPRLAEMLGRLGVPEGEESPEQAAAAVELALEGLYLTRRLAKDTEGGRTVYGS